MAVLEAVVTSNAWFLVVAPYIHVTMKVTQRKFSHWLTFLSLTRVDALVSSPLSISFSTCYEGHSMPSTGPVSGPAEVTLPYPALKISIPLNTSLNQDFSFLETHLHPCPSYPLHTGLPPDPRRCSVPPGPSFMMFPPSTLISCPLLKSLFILQEQAHAISSRILY